MRITKLRATRIGFHAHQYLQATRSSSDRVARDARTGAVVSVFQHGFNVLFDEVSNPGLVSIQTKEVPLHPWSIGLTGTTRTPEVGAPCFAEATLIRFDNELCIDIVAAEVRKLRITPWAQEEADLAQERIPIIKGFLAQELATRAPDPFQTQIDTILSQWMKHGESAKLRDLIGLGSGSTPSGDDVLVSILLGLWALKAVSPQAARHLATLRGSLHIEEIRGKTPLPSVQMIAAALDGAFPEVLCDLVSQLGQADVTDAEVQQCVERVGNLGATSGLSFLCGFVAALSADVHLP